jgi:hypothetical protein
MIEDNKDAELLIPQERRDYPRIGINIHVKYRVLGTELEDAGITKRFDPDKTFEKSIQDKAINISTSGLLMYCAEEIKIKSFVAVSMYLPLPGLSCSCRALAQVIRCDPGNGNYILALKFIKVLFHDLTKYKFMTLTDLLEIKGEDIKLD